MTDRRRILGWAAVSSRLVLGTAVAVAVVLAVVVAVAAPWPGHAAAPAAVEATPAAADSVLSCTGPLVALGRDAADASALAVAAEQSVVSGADGAAATESTVTPVPSIDGDDGATVITAEPEDGAPTDVAAAGSAEVEADDIRGFAASSCRAALTESWLVAGATTTGASDVLLLSNPGDVAATVDITVYTATGAQTPAGATGIVVAPGTQRVLPLSSLTVGESAPVLRITSSGAPVTAALQSSIIRTLLPGGVDTVSATESTSEQVVIPGVVVSDTAVAADDSGATSIVRMLAPQASTTATVTATDADGTVVSTQQVPLTADLPLELELDGLAQGTYTVTVTADTGLVAAVWQATGLGEGSDFAWYSAAPEITADTLVAVPEGPSPTLALTVDAAATAATVTLTPEDGGDVLTATVGPGETVSVALEEDEVYRMSTTAAVHGALTYAGDGALAAIPVWPAPAAASVLTVYP